jgi:thioesterase domain-containing protein
VRSLVFDAWRASIPAKAFDPDLSLADSGADSLKVLGMILRIERALGRPVPLDLFDADTSARSLADGLATEDVPADADLRAPFFFLPGIGGDQSMMASIRRALEQRIRFSVVRYPDEMPGGEPDFAALAASVGRQISDEQPEGALSLAGYSFGGVLAVEVARYLRAHGREVALLVLFDAIPLRSVGERLMEIISQPQLVLRKLRRRVRYFRSSWKAARSERRVLFLVRWVGAYGLLAKLHRREASRDEAAVALAERFQTWAWRAEAMQSWKPVSIDVRALLILSEDGVFARVEQLWSSILPRLTCLRVAGDHGEMAEAPALGLIVNAIDEALAPHDKAQDR